jgi:hypothetical protein
MDSIDERHAVVDLTTLADIAGALEADVDAGQVRVQRAKGNGEQEQVVLYFPAGIRIVRRR